MNNHPHLDHTRDWWPTARPAPVEASPFRNADTLLDAAMQLLKAREDQSGFLRLPRQTQEALSAEEGFQAPGPNALAWAQTFHQSFDLTGDGVDLCRRCLAAGLSPLERELLIVQVLARLSLLPPTLSSAGRLLEAVGLPSERTLEGLRALTEEGRLARNGLLLLEEEPDDPTDRKVSVDPDLVIGLLRDPAAPRGWPVKTEEELYQRLEALLLALRDKIELLEEARRGMSYVRRRLCTCKPFRKAARLRSELAATLEEHPDWALSRLIAAHRLDDIEGLLLVTLLGKALGYLDRDERLFYGSGLARVAGESDRPSRQVLRALGPNGKLFSRGLVQPCDGTTELLDDDPRSLEAVEFELGEQSLEFLGLGQKMLLKRHYDEGLIREPKVRLSQLVLPDEVRKALGLVLAQARHAERLLEDWGLGQVIPYGQAVTLLFYGLPGVGKTACAEALAHTLKKPILVADYSQIQSCFVGQTEKNIVKTFRAARKSGAVLFWDEADAMFVDRNQAQRPFEVRDVNVLLQQLERFEGICILATNRELSFDPALARRISLKVEFTFPDQAMRRRIWEKLLPRKLPLAPGVDLDELARAELSGGEIKNAVLNAARMALARGRRGKLRMGDFREAIAIESGRTTKRAGAGPIGFRK